MNKLKKTLVLVCCAALLVCISVGATVAYLTSKTDVVQNTFTVGDVEIILDETDVDLYGVKDGETRVTANEYKLLPGHTYIKDPMVTVKANSEESYIRMFVTITDYADVKAVFGEDFLPEKFVNGWDSTTWVSTNVVSVDTEKNTATYEFRYKETVNTLNGQDLELDPLFDEIFVPGTVDNDALAKLEDMQINIVAYAIQADGFGGSADAAWAAYDKTVELPVPPIPTAAPETDDEAAA